MEIFDTHAHLLDKIYDGKFSLNNKDCSTIPAPAADTSTNSFTLRDEILARAVKENLYIIESALNEEEWDNASHIASCYENLFFTTGIHPHTASHYASFDTSWIDRMKKFFHQGISNSKCVAIGETGLDYHYDSTYREEQKKVFKKQIELALELSKPIVVHCREAYEDCYEILKSYSNKWRGVVHCFSGDVTESQRFLSLGFYLGITCPVTYPKSDKLKKVVTMTPLENLLTETDSPYLPPSHLRGKRNEPSNVRYVIEEIARLKKLSFEHVASITSINARQLFGIK